MKSKPTFPKTEGRVTFHAVFGLRFTLDYQQRGNISSRLSCNSEAFASELLDNIEEMFPRY